MPDTPEEQLRFTVAAIQQRFGHTAIRKLDSLDPSARLSRLSTGYPQLDEVLGTGGIPRRGITEFVGIPTSGMETLAFKAIANAQNHDEGVVFVDPERAFDPDYATACGVAVDDLLLIHDAPHPQVLDLVRDVVASGVVGLVVFRSSRLLFEKGQSPQAIEAGLRRLKAAVAKSPCGLLFLTSQEPHEGASRKATWGASALRSIASLRLLVARETWLNDESGLCGYQSKVTVLKNHLGASGRSVYIDITFNDLRGASP